MVKAEKPCLTVEFKYDPFGRRIEKKTTTGGVPVSFTYVYDGDDVVAQVSNSTVTHFLHGSGTDEHLSLTNGSGSFYYLQDGLGSVTRITNSAQTVVQSYSYDSFGNSSSVGSIDQPYRFTGREYDAETGLNYHHARYLDLSVGRWLSRDPIGFAAGDVVLWNYVGGNPVNYTDPSGLIAPAIAVPLYYTGAKLLAVGTAWLGYKTATTSMRVTGLASPKQTCDAQKAGNTAMKSVAAVNVAGAPLAMGPGLATYYGPSLYTTGMVWAGTANGITTQKWALDFVSGFATPDPPPPNWMGVAGTVGRMFTDSIRLTSSDPLPSPLELFGGAK